MPLLHCKDCHHEWEGKKSSRCDWCGGKSYVLQEVSDFEKFVRYDLRRIVKEWVKENLKRCKNETTLKS
jgi:hypothetical protein